MSTPGVKVGVSEEEKKLSYYKYYEQDLAPVPAEKIAILQGGPIAPEKCIPFDERNKFLKGEDDEYDLIEAGLLEELGDSKEFSYQVFANVALRAVFSGTVSITNTEIANTTVYTKDGKLIVKDGKVGCEVFVYDVLGQVVKSFIIENALETVQLGTTSSLYLVKIVDGADCIVKKVGNM